MVYIKGADTDSLNISRLFLRKLRKIGISRKPYREIFDNTWSLTWRKDGRGIINIAFHDSGIATWAAYAPSYPDGREKCKGKFRVLEGVPVSVSYLIKEICGDV